MCQRNIYRQVIKENKRFGKLISTCQSFATPNFCCLLIHANNPLANVIGNYNKEYDTVFGIHT